MKKLYLIILVMLLVITLSGCERKAISTDNETYGIGSNFTAMEIEKRKYEIESAVPIKFFYGHDNLNEPGDPNYEMILGFELIVLLYGKNDPEIKFDESVILYSKAFETNEFLTDEYRVGFKPKFFGDPEIEFNQNFDFDLDLSTFDFEEGRIAIAISQSHFCEPYDCDTGVVTYTEEAYLDFTVSDEYVKFD